MNDPSATGALNRQTAIAGALRNAIGSAQVTADACELAAYVDDLSGTAIKNMPLVAARARTLEDVQAIVGVANAMKARGLKGYARSVAMGRARSSALASQWADRGGLDAFYSWSRGNNGFRSDGSR